MKLTRRDFLKGAKVAAGLALFGFGSGCITKKPEELTTPPAPPPVPSPSVTLTVKPIPTRTINPTSIPDITTPASIPAPTPFPTRTYEPSRNPPTIIPASIPPPAVTAIITPSPTPTPFITSIPEATITAVVTSPIPTFPPLPSPTAAPSLEEGLTGRWLFDTITPDGYIPDISGYGNHGYLHRGKSGTSGKIVSNGKTDYLQLDGNGGYVEILDNGKYSVPGTNQLEICFWAKPTSFDFPTIEEGKWVDFLAKEMGDNGKQQCEWAFRIYRTDGKDPDPRPKRMSFYVFNEGCGLGTGSYFQDPLNENEWIFVDGAVTGENTQIYKNTEKRDEDYYAGEGAFAVVNPKHGSSPVTIGTSWDDGSYSMGGFYDLRIYSKLLTPEKRKLIYDEGVKALT